MESRSFIKKVFDEMCIRDRCIVLQQLYASVMPLSHGHGYAADGQGLNVTVDGSGGYTEMLGQLAGGEGAFV